jgi:hypothetical protein
MELSCCCWRTVNMWISTDLGLYLSTIYASSKLCFMKIATESLVHRDLQGMEPLRHVPLSRLCIVS